MSQTDPIADAREKLADQVSAQSLRLTDSIAALIRENDARGELKSSETLMQATLLCCQALQDRVDMFLEVIPDILKKAGTDKDELGPTELGEAG